MNTEYLNVLVVDRIVENIDLFKSILNEIKVGVKLTICQNANEILKYLDSDDTIVPEVVFMNYDIFKNDILDEIVKRKKFCDVITAIYSEEISDIEIEDFFVKSGNICIKKTESKSVFKKKISEAITVNWQYHTSGLNKDNFILKI